MQDASVLEEPNQREIVSFRVADQDFCIDIGHVREIRGWSETTPLPHTPEYVKGLVNLRGNVIPVIDLAHRLGLGHTDPGERHVIVITVCEERIAGLLVEAVSDIVTVDCAEMKHPPSLTSSAAREVVEGVFVIRESLVRMIDLARVLPSEAEVSE